MTGAIILFLDANTENNQAFQSRTLHRAGVRILGGKSNLEGSKEIVRDNDSREVLSVHGQSRHFEQTREGVYQAQEMLHWPHAKLKAKPKLRVHVHQNETQSI